MGGPGLRLSYRPAAGGVGQVVAGRVDPQAVPLVSRSQWVQPRAHLDRLPPLGEGKPVPCLLPLTRLVPNVPTCCIVAPADIIL